MDWNIVEPIFTRSDARGLFQEISRDQLWATVIVGRFHAQGELGHHYHLKTTLLVFLVSGSAVAIIENIDTQTRHKTELITGQGIYLPPGCSHVIRFHQESEFLILKSLPYDPADPDTYPYPIKE